jgi:hypothetical protein
MATLERKSFNNPNETRTFPLAKAEFVSFGAMPVVRATYEPGWRWSEHAKSVFGTESCQIPHFWYIISGHITIQMTDGTKADFGPGDIGSVPPGHDGWVV